MTDQSAPTTWWTTPYEDLRVEAREASGRRIAVVTFDLPERRNSMSTAMTASWVRLMGLLRQDSELAAVVVTGEGSAFNAGGDLSWIVSEPDAQVADLRTRMLAFYRSWLTVKQLEVPTIAAINGHAIGAGFALALALDVRYAAADAKLGVPFTSLGLHPGMATTWSLPDVAGHAVARDLLLTGRIVTGEEAVGLGLVSLAAPAEEVLGHALAAAERVAAAAPVATRLTLQAVRDGGHASYERALEWEALAQAVTLATDDLHEGIAAAAEKRRPTFHGR
ncbi:enoyl-CoA hydratase/isomerase family protein [Phycicoccus sp. SLBN-51]|uniref:enoyl-CoA hydratase/isomerase family protein n=1 Tax=Phycicoccus sp. SLBN-51 TaxID=2768447 RepID=UPI00114DE049|nr:enoyl-CoA hydratase/isomerase family protein [Phycicoccus sp. SLBN-51]TQJ49772.1 enoyl-CoA hydratase/carnithine racemase [Phycicoccus sp. SLBN-51]